MPVTEQGLFEDRYKIIPRVLIFVTCGDKVLLLKGSPNKKIWPDLYNGIGGHIEKGESVLEAAHREFMEETGLILINPWLCAVITIDTQQSTGIGMLVFRGTVNDEQVKESDEGTPEWIDIGLVAKLTLVEDLPILIPKIITRAENDPVIYAQYHYNSEENLQIRFS